MNGILPDVRGSRYNQSSSKLHTIFPLHMPHPLDYSVWLGQISMIVLADGLTLLLGL
jgi:hypothetical protein